MLLGLEGYDGLYRAYMLEHHPIDPDSTDESDRERLRVLGWHGFSQDSMLWMTMANTITLFYQSWRQAHGAKDKDTPILFAPPNTIIDSSPHGADGHDPSYAEMLAFLNSGGH